MMEMIYVTNWEGKSEPNGGHFTVKMTVLMTGKQLIALREQMSLLIKTTDSMVCPMCGAEL